MVVLAPSAAWSMSLSGQLLQWNRTSDHLAVRHTPCDVRAPRGPRAVLTVRSRSGHVAI